MDTNIIKNELAKITQAVGTLAAMDSGESAMKTMKSDYQAYFKEVPVGSKPIPWCEGTLTRLEGAGYYQLPDGRYLTFTPSTDLTELYSVPEIRKSFDKNYPNAFKFFEAIFAIQLSVKNITVQVGVVAGSPVAPPLPPPSSAKLIWLRDKTAVVAAAKAQGKKIFLLAGRENCSVTTGMRDIACESIDPPYKQLIEQHYVPWFIDVDHVPGDVQFDGWYNPGRESFNMPLMACIDPNNVQVALEWPFKERCGNVDLIPMLKKYA